MANTTLPQHFADETKNAEVRKIVKAYADGWMRVRKYQQSKEIEEEILKTFHCSKEIAKISARIVKTGRYVFYAGRTRFRVTKW